VSDDIMKYLTHLLGHVAHYGVRAEEASNMLIEKTVEEYSVLLSQRTGISFSSLAELKGEVSKRMETTSFTEPTPCKGTTKHGAPCKRLTLMGYCPQHHAQDEETLQKKRRIEDHFKARKKPQGRNFVRPMPYRFEF